MKSMLNQINLKMHDPFVKKTSTWLYKYSAVIDGYQHIFIFIYCWEYSTSILVSKVWTALVFGFTLINPIIIYQLKHLPFREQSWHFDDFGKLFYQKYYIYIVHFTEIDITQRSLVNIYTWRHSWGWLHGSGKWIRVGCWLDTRSWCWSWPWCNPWSGSRCREVT